MYCKKCNTYVPAIYCPKCGTPVESEEQSKKSSGISMARCLGPTPHFYDSNKYDRCPVCDCYSKPEGLDKEYRNVFMQTVGEPIGDTESAWQWIKDRLVYFREKGLEKDKLMKLETNVLMHLTQKYVEHFEEFLEAAGNADEIVDLCETLIVQKQAVKAKEIAEPYLIYLTKHHEKYKQGRLCFQDQLEEAIFWSENENTEEYEKTEDNYTYFIMLYLRILTLFPHRTREEFREFVRFEETWLLICSNISPCNSGIWAALAEIYSDSDEKKYLICINKALRYSYSIDERYGLGAIYANIAMHHAMSNPRLADALCGISDVFGGKPLAARFVLSKQRYKLLKDKEAAELMEAAGVPIGFSELVKSVKSERVGTTCYTYYNNIVSVEMEYDLRHMRFIVDEHTIKYEYRPSICAPISHLYPDGYFDEREVVVNREGVKEKIIECLRGLPLERNTEDGDTGDSRATYYMKLKGRFGEYYYYNRIIGKGGEDRVADEEFIILFKFFEKFCSFPSAFNPELPVTPREKEDKYVKMFENAIFNARHGGDEFQGCYAPFDPYGPVDSALAKGLANDMQVLVPIENPEELLADMLRLDSLKIGDTFTTDRTVGIGFCHLTVEEGKYFIPLFTSKEEMYKAMKQSCINQGLCTLLSNIDNWPDCLGVTVNISDSKSMVLDRDTIKTLFSIKPKSNICAVRGSAVDMHVDAIVNFEEYTSLDRGRVGEAKVTVAYNITNADYIIHIVKPMRHGKTKWTLLTDCYKNALNAALEKNCTSVAFPCISAESHGYSLETVARISTMAAMIWLQEHRDTFMDIYFCCFSDAEAEVYKALWKYYEMIK